MLHATIWTLALTLAPTLFPTRQLVAEGFSTLAIVSMSVNLMLSTRARFLERRLQGLDKLFVTHRTIGLTVAALVSTHYLLVPKSVGYVPSKPVGYTTISLLLLAVFLASAPRFPWRRLVPLKYQTWKLTHRFMGLIVALAVTHSLLAHTFVKTAPLLAGYVYGVATLGLTAWLYREFLFSRLGPIRAFEVGSVRTLGGDVTEVTLGESSRALARSAGQFAVASFSAGPSTEAHPFTISSGAHSDMRFSIKASGDFTRALRSGVPVGSAVRVEGPYGAFDYRRGRPSQVWLAGGIGITPFLSMAEDLDAHTAVTLIWSVHDRREAIYEDDLTRLAQLKPNLDFRVHVTSQQGHLDVSTLEIEGSRRDFSYFICGPLPLRRAIIGQLHGLGVARDRVHFEEFRLR